MDFDRRSSMLQNLTGRWDFRKEGSDHYEGLDSIPGVPRIALMSLDASYIEIEISDDAYQELIITTEINRQKYRRHLQPGKLAYHDFPQSDPPATAAVVHCADRLHEFSYLTMGPGKEQRSLVHLRMDSTGNGFRADLQMLLPMVGELKLVKYFTRISDCQTLDVLNFARLSSNWISTITTPTELENITIEIIDTVNLILTENGFDWEDDIKKNKYQGTITPLKCVKDSFKEATVCYFVVQVRFGEHIWYVLHRFSEFVTLHAFIREQIKGGNNSNLDLLPEFPKKTLLGKPTGQSLEKRKQSLDDYLSKIILAKGYSKVNVVESLFAFLEVPENLGKYSVSINSNTRYGDDQSVASTALGLPQDVLHSKLSVGIEFMKHSRSRFKSKPEKRVLRCDAGVTTLFWGDPNDQAGTSTKSLKVSEIIDVTHGMMETPTKDRRGSQVGGSDNLRRKSLNNNYLSLCVSIITIERSLDIQCLNKEDCRLLFDNLRKMIGLPPEK